MNYINGKNNTRGNIKTMNNNLKELIVTLGFTSVDDFKSYMKSRARLNEYGAICYNEKRNGLELNYSNNCKHKYGIGGNDRGIYKGFRFN